MCGRYTLKAEPEAIQKQFELAFVPEQLTPRFNIAPSQAVPIITADDRDRLTFVRWGLIPSWSKDESLGNKLINARSETADEKPSFRAAFKRRRCLIPADGFFEWMKDGKVKRPQFIFLPDSPVFAFAGLWETWHSPHGDEVLSCTILTTEPNDMMRQIHNRMPVILPKNSYEMWLDHSIDTQAAKSLLKPYDQDEMDVYEVSTRVNSPANDSPDIIEPFTPPEQQSLL